MKNLNLRSGLLATTTLCGAMLVTAAVGLAAPANAQTTSTTTTDTTAKKDAAPTEVVVTGSILRRKNLNTDAPLTIVTADDLDKRGVTTIQSAIQNLSNNGSGALPNSFSANGAFATGASGASLRGLTTDSTLVLFDGMRAAYYPYADDGVRNFVDLNTIPDAIVDHIEVLQDGASSSYGADAIAGVINIITKKQVKGLSITVDGGTSQHGGADSNHASFTWGKGDLGADGWNFYVSGEYQRDDQLKNSDRGYPYNTANLSGQCTQSLDTDKADWGAPGSGINANGMTCRNNAVINAIQADGSFLGVGTTTVATVEPYKNGVSTGGNWQLLNTAAGCGSLPSVTVTQAEVDQGGDAATHVVGSKLCQMDTTNLYSVIQPLDKRMSLSAHGTKQWSDGTQAWVEGNIYRNEVAYSGAPDTLTRGTAAGDLSPTVTPSPLLLPVYVCPRGTTVACTASNGTLNPNDPFASLGEQARLVGKLDAVPYTTDDQEVSERLAFGLKGIVAGSWHYNIGGTMMENDLTETVTGVQNVQHLLDVIADGSYNFVNPSQNSAAVDNYVAPPSVLKAKSQMAMLQGDVNKDLWALPGGSLQLGLGAAARYEMVDDPSANPDETNPANRYASLINAFGTKGQRTTMSAYYDIDAPVFTQLDVNTSGRYDTYSSGQSAFSPKIGFIYKPFDMLTIRGTASKGFRIPSFGEANSLPTTGYLPEKAPASFATAHGNDGYQNYSLGETTLGTPGLKPEKSTNFTGGFVIQPTHTVSFTIDYYYIQKTDVIAGADPTAAIADYFAGKPIPAGFKVIPGIADPNFPNALAVPQYVQFGYANLNKEITSGVDFGANARFTLPYGVKWNSGLSATWVQRFDLYTGGIVQHFAGTIGPQGPTSGSGTPSWRGNWQNTFVYGPTTITATTYYTSGYSVEAADNGDTLGDCLGSGTVAFYRDSTTPVQCHVHSFLYTDVTADYKYNANYELFLNVGNLFDTKAPLDAATYGGYQYNPVWANSGVIGRYFKLGVKATF